MMKIIIPVFILFSSFLCFGQPPAADPFPGLQQYLQLTPAQGQAIFNNNDAYNRWSNDKQTRIRQVQAEIAEETAKERLDGQALGVRYLEIEAICRDIKTRANEDRAKNLALLNADQRAKLNVLEDAIRLMPVISQAQSGNLAGGNNSAPAYFISDLSSRGGTFLGGGIFGGSVVGGCYQPALLSGQWFDSPYFVRETTPRQP